MKVTVNEIEQLEDRVDEKKQRFLEQNGWKCSCENPLSIWLWEKKINGKHFTLDRNLAYDLQRELDVE